MGINTRNMQSCLQKCNKLNKSHLVGQLLNVLNIIQIFWDLRPCILVNIHPWVILGSC